MNSVKRITMAALATLMVLAGGHSLPAQDATPIAIQGVPASATRIKITLAPEGNSAGPQGYYRYGQVTSYRERQSMLDKIPAEVSSLLKNKDAFVFQLGEFPGGTTYYAAVSPDNSVNRLDRDASQLWYIQMICASEGKAEVVKEGVAMNSDVRVPVRVTLPKVGVNPFTFDSSIGLQISGSSNGRPTVQATRGVAPVLQGSHVLEVGKLNVSVTLDDESNYTTASTITLNFSPFKVGLPDRSASGKPTDILTLGGARLAATEMAADFSSITLAVLDGSLEEDAAQQLALGAEMPNFSQIDLLARKPVTRADVLEQAREEGTATVFVFGDFRVDPRNYMPPQQTTGYLPVGADQITSLLLAEVPQKPAVYFVVREISMEDYFGKYAADELPYHLVADYTDPLRTTFRMPPSPYGGYGGFSGGNPSGDASMTLRQLFNLPEGTCSLVAFDASGKVIHVMASLSGDQFTGALGELNKLLIATPAQPSGKTKKKR